MQASRAAQKRTRLGSENTHCRYGARGNTRSQRNAAVSDIRRAVQEGHTPRALQGSPSHMRRTAREQSRAPGFHSRGSRETRAHGAANRIRVGWCRGPSPASSPGSPSPTRRGASFPARAAGNPRAGGWQRRGSARRRSAEPAPESSQQSPFDNARVWPILFGGMVLLKIGLAVDGYQEARAGRANLVG